MIGATNFPGRIATPLASRFPLTIHVPPFSAIQRGKLFASILKEELETGPTFQFDQELLLEVANSCPQLGEASNGMSVRDIGNQIVILFGDLRVHHEKNPAIVLSVTLTELLMRINPVPVAVSAGSFGCSFFPQRSPEANSNPEPASEKSYNK